MPLRIAPPTSATEHLPELLYPEVAAWAEDNPLPPWPEGRSRFYWLTSRPLLGWLLRLWRFHLRRGWDDLPDAFRYGYVCAALRGLLCDAMTPLWFAPAMAGVLAFKRFAPLRWRAKARGWWYVSRVMRAERRAWLRERPTREEVRSWFVLQLGRDILADELRRSREEMERAARLDQVLRFVFGVTPLDPDDMGFHSAN